MLARAHRFHGYNALRAIYQRGQTARAGQLNLKYSQREGAQPTRVAVVVSRKVSKSAVVRNRIRRRIYEGVRRSPQYAPTGCNLVLTAYHEQLATLPAPELQRLIDDVLAKVTVSM
ncbi:MAG TPA: ribonuclease P protein component [Candidatus Saccharimonadales bacterium]|nr:ribonuclease P protein component [Candidatus Saccharimonadales bacterium]